MYLQILLGRERGRVYAVEEGYSYTIGRSSDCDLVLASDFVSRSHAQLAVGSTDVTIADVGSSNGTYVNGARVLGEGVVEQGDVLLVGEVAMRLHTVTVPELFPDGGYRVELDAANNPLVTLSGSLVEIPPSTVLRHLAVVKKTGALVLTSPPLQSRIKFARGHISEVIIEKRKMDPIQALTMMLRWRGTFELGPPCDVSSTRLLGLDAVLPAVGTASRVSTMPKPT
jgi:hypothetical protein